MAAADVLSPDMMLLSSLVIQYNRVIKASIGHLYVVPDAENARVWRGTVFTRSAYGGAPVQFRLEFPAEFLSHMAAPALFVTSRNIRHPLIERSTGRVRLDDIMTVGGSPSETLARDMLAAFKQLFFQTTPEISSLLERGLCHDMELAELIRNDPEEYAQFVRAAAREPLETSDPKAMPLTSTDPRVHELRDFLREKKRGLKEIMHFLQHHSVVSGQQPRAAGDPDAVESAAATATAAAAGGRGGGGGDARSVSPIRTGEA